MSWACLTPRSRRTRSSTSMDGTPSAPPSPGDRPPSPARAPASPPGRRGSRWSRQPNDCALSARPPIPARRCRSSVGWPRSARGPRSCRPESNGCSTPARTFWPGCAPWAANACSPRSTSRPSRGRCSGRTCPTVGAPSSSRRTPAGRICPSRPAPANSDGSPCSRAKPCCSGSWTTTPPSDLLALLVPRGRVAWALDDATSARERTDACAGGRDRLRPPAPSVHRRQPWTFVHFPKSAVAARPAVLLRLGTPNYGGPVVQRWFEDYAPGAIAEFGPIRVDETEVVDFGRRFDPQPFHVDAGAAAAGPFGGLIASGWHTCALMMRLFAQEFLSPASSLASPGVDELRWILPVRPGDELVLRTTVEEARSSRSKPERGLVRTRIELINQADEVVLRMVAMNLIRRRPRATEP